MAKRIVVLKNGFITVSETMNNFIESHRQHSNRSKLKPPIFMKQA